MRRTFIASERGNATYTVLVMVTLLGFGALVLDVGRARVVKAELQNAVDAGTHAGISQLDGTSDGVDAAKEVAAYIANLNLVNGVSPGITEDMVQVGLWEDGAFDASVDDEDANAVRIEAQVDDIGAIFGGTAFGVSELAAGAAATATQDAGGPTSAGDCYLPMAIPDCWFDSGYTDAQIMDVAFLFSPATSDTIGWASPSGNPNASYVSGALTDLYDGDDSCAGEVRIGDSIYLGNGVQNSSLMTMADVFADSTQYWDSTATGTRPDRSGNSMVSTADYDAGKVIAGPIMVFDGGSGYSCPAPGSGTSPLGGFTGTADLKGFVWAVIYDVTNGSAAQKNVKARLDMSSYHDWGTETDPEAPDLGVIIEGGSPKIVQ